MKENRQKRARVEEEEVEDYFDELDDANLTSSDRVKIIRKLSPPKKEKFKDKS